MRGDVQAPLTIILAMVMLVIGMAVVNVASLLLVRAAARAQEISVRYALGATSRQVLRQLLAEGMILGLAGAALGLALAPEALRLLIHRLSANMRRVVALRGGAQLARSGLVSCGHDGGKLAVQSGTRVAVPESATGRGDAADGREPAAADRSSFGVRASRCRLGSACC